MGPEDSLSSRKKITPNNSQDDYINGENFTVWSIEIPLIFILTYTIQVTISFKSSTIPHRS